MKTITIRLPDVEAAMLLEVLKVNKAYRDLQGLLINQIQTEYRRRQRVKRQSNSLAPTPNTRRVAPNSSEI